MGSKRYDIDYIREQSQKVLVKRGVPEVQAAILTDSFLEADMCGVPTHGIRMLPSYIKKIDNNEFSFEGITIKKGSCAFSVVDSNNSIGAVSAYQCTQLAIEGAKKSGLHAVFARNCCTFGPAFYYVKMMAEKGLVGYVSCNSPAAMPANNGLEVMLGTNPFAFACPSKSSGTILIDMATSIVAKSKFLEAKNKGQQLPNGWALDSDGNPTTDPDAAIRGFVLPMAGVKGYGIALMIDILSGALSGASYLNKVGKFYSTTGAGMNVGQVFVAIDPSSIYEGDFLEEMDAYVRILRNSRTLTGKAITLPGDKKKEMKKYAESYGLELIESTVMSMCDLFGVEELKVV